MATTYAGEVADTLTNNVGRPYVAPITVRLSGTATSASLYIDSSRTVTLANPLPTGVPAGSPGVDVYGNYIYWTDPGEYEEWVLGVYMRHVTVNKHPLEPEAAVVDVLRKSGVDQATTANTDFLGLLRRNGQNVATDIRFNVLEEGLATNASVNEAYAKAGAAAAAGRDAVVWLPTGEYTFTPDPTTGISVPLIYPNVTFEGLGRIKTADGIGYEWVGHFAAPNFTTDTSGCKWRGLTFDANMANNPIDLEDQLLEFNGDWRTRRNPIGPTAIGTDMRVDECQFIDSPRQSVMFPGRAPGDIKRIRVTGCDFLTTIDGPHDTDHDWDTTAVFSRGDDVTIDNNNFQGFGTAYYISRTAVQASGSRVHVNRNNFDLYYRAIILGNPGYPGVVEAIEACGNKITRSNGGIEFQALNFDDYLTSMGPAVRGVTISQNHISTDKVNYQRATTEGGTPYGIMQRGDPNDPDLPVEIVEIEGNTIRHHPGYTTGGGHGISFAKDPEVDTPLDSSVSYLKVSKNSLVNCGRNGIAMRTNSLLVAEVELNTIVDCATRAGITTQNAAAIRVTGDVTALTAAGNNVIDTRPVRLVTYAVHADCTALRGAHHKPGTLYAADGTQIPPLFSANATSLFRVDDLHPRVVAVTDDYTLQLADDGAVIEVNKATAVAVTIPPAVTAPAAAWSSAATYVSGEFVSYGGSFYKAIAGSTNVTPGTDATKWVLAVPWAGNAAFELYQQGAGQVTVTAGNGVTLRAPNGAKTAKQYATIGVRYRGTDICVVSGDTTT